MNRIALSSVSVHLSIPLGSGERSISDKARPPPRGQAEDEVRYRVPRLQAPSQGSEIRNPKSKISRCSKKRRKKQDPQFLSVLEIKNFMPTHKINVQYLDSLASWFFFELQKQRTHPHINLRRGPQFPCHYENY